MNTSLPTHSKPNTGQAALRLQLEHERATTLHVKFAGIEERPSERALSKRLSSVARHLHGQPFKCAPDYRWKLSAKTALRCWYQWLRGGKTPAALVRRYDRSSGHRRRITVQHLVRFIDELARPETRSAMDAWRRLCGQSPVTYSATLRHLPRHAFRQLAAARADAERAQEKFADVRLGLTGHAVATLADQPPADWEI